MWINWAGTALAITLLLNPAAAEQKETKFPNAVPATDPVGWIVADDYPDAALRADLEGTVGVQIDVDAAGHPTTCEITTSSGSPTLDQAACEALKKRAAFVPGKGRRIYKRTVNWKMPTPPVGQPIDVARNTFSAMRFDMEITTGVNGAIESCRLISAEPKDFNPCQQTPIGQSQGPGYVRNGKPVRAVVRQTFSSTTTFVDVP